MQSTSNKGVTVNASTIRRFNLSTKSFEDIELSTLTLTELAREQRQAEDRAFAGVVIGGLGGRDKALAAAIAAEIASR